MAIPIRSTPVLEGEVAKRFERERRRAERERGTIKISQDDWDFYSKTMDDFRNRLKTLRK